MHKNSKSENSEYIQIKKKKFKLLKFIIIFIIILIVFSAIKTGIYISSWQKLATDMISNTSSIVLDTDGKTIAEIGNSKIRSNISMSEMPNYLKNAYISIEDQRFYKHSGVDLPRTSAAIFSYINTTNAVMKGSNHITTKILFHLHNSICRFI